MMTTTSLSVNQSREILMMNTSLAATDWEMTRERARLRGVYCLLIILVKYVLDFKARRFGRISWQEDHKLRGRAFVYGFSWHSSRGWILPGIGLSHAAG